MSDVTAAFTIEEADRLIGRRVKLVRDIPSRYTGETGTVADKIEERAGYFVVVIWDIRYGTGASRCDWFTRSSFEAFVREV